MQSKAKTVSEYINELPADRKAAIQKMRALIKKSLQKGFQEAMAWGMITYSVPLKLYSEGYGGNPKVPLPYISLASQKNYLALYMMNLYADPKADQWFREAYKKSGKKLDMGKGCLRFKKLDDLPLDVIAKAIGIKSAKEHAALYDSTRKRARK